jgi:hypothetical protein
MLSWCSIGSVKTYLVMTKPLAWRPIGSVKAFLMAQPFVMSHLFCQNYLGVTQHLLVSYGSAKLSRRHPTSPNMQFVHQKHFLIATHYQVQSLPSY